MMDCPLFTDQPIDTTHFVSSLPFQYFLSIFLGSIFFPPYPLFFSISIFETDNHLQPINQMSISKVINSFYTLSEYASDALVIYLNMLVVLCLHPRWWRYLGAVELTTRVSLCFCFIYLKYIRLTPDEHYVLFN